MTSVQKIRIAVLYGGRSSEHEVSLQSAANVIKYLDPNRFEVIPIGIDKSGKWHIGEQVFAESLSEHVVKALPSDTWFTPEWVGKSFEQQEMTAFLKNSKLPNIDVIFPCVHGVLCEDGTLQGLLELANVPYIGAGVLCSSICMDKDVSKRLAKAAGIKVPPYFVFKKHEWDAKKQQCVAKMQELHFPLFIKPANTGSSVGVTKVKSASELERAVDFAFLFDQKIVVEKGLRIQELEVAVLESLQEGDQPIASVVGEIQPSHEFYSYEAKYVDEFGAKLCIPAELEPELAQAAQALAQTLFTVLECEGMARVDLFYDLDSKQLYFNEINTLPGFTKISMYPKLMEATGISYSDLLTHLVELAMKRFRARSQLIRAYERLTEMA